MDITNVDIARRRDSANGWSRLPQPPLPAPRALPVQSNTPTLAPERIKDYRAQNVADWVMYRKALASAAEARGRPVHWYNTYGANGQVHRAAVWTRLSIKPRSGGS